MASSINDKCRSKPTAVRCSCHSSVADHPTHSLAAFPDTPDVSEQSEYSDDFEEAELEEDYEDESASIHTSTPQLRHNDSSED